ncbi:MAG: YgfZ/GcvT domain-containing protein, partial [Janthinobacterium lividum]
NLTPGIYRRCMTHTSGSTDISHAFTALRTGAGVSDLSASAGLDMPGSGWIAVTGDDRVRWLNGMVTNSVQALTTGEGAYTFLLSAQGRIQGDATVWAEADRLLLQTSADQVAPMLTMLDRFIIMDDVELHDLSAEMHGLLIAGPLAVEKLQAVGIAARGSKLLKRQATTWRDRPVMLTNAYSLLVPRIEVWSQHAEDNADLHKALLAEGVIPCDGAAVELLRIAEGTPRFGKDIRDRDLPQETAQTRALHFNKGCYLGQEIVERIRSRGNVHRTFAAFLLHGDQPQPGTPLMADEKQVGELTSVAAQQIDGELLALGFVRREALERGQPLLYAGGSAEPRARTAAS